MIGDRDSAMSKSFQEALDRLVGISRISRRKITEALEHYRCPSCGETNPGFFEREVRIVTFRLGYKKWGWKMMESLPVKEYAYEDADMVSEDIARSFVRCDNCEEVVVMPDGSPVTVENFHEWSEDLARRWLSRQAERESLAEQLAKAKESLNPVGTVADLEAKLAALESVS